MSDPMTITDANNRLPLVRSIALDIMQLWNLIVPKREQVDIVKCRLESRRKYLSFSGLSERNDEEVQTFERRYQELKDETSVLIDRINGYIKEIEELGCFVEEFKRGVVNFPTLYNGRKVFLCWTPEDDQISYWHDMDESYSQRREIPSDCRGFWNTAPAMS